MKNDYRGQDLPEMLTIVKVVRESPRVKTFFFNKKLNSKPGQFIMLWLPGVGERPVAVIEERAGFRVSVARVGKVSEAMHKLKAGGKTGIRGPFGTSFTLPKSKGELVMVGGGYGIVPLMYLSLIAKKQKYNPIILNGARTKKELLYQAFAREKKIKMMVATDDGSLGKKGFVHQLLLEYLSKNKKPKKLYICGPELMEFAVAKICWKKNIPFQASIERHMKCAIGVCGSCCVDPSGWRMCVEGPVVEGSELKKISEFGKYHRSASGIKHPF